MSSSEDSARTAALNLIKAVNDMGFDYAAFASEICTSHRTLQQSAMRAFAECIKVWADNARPGCHDLRNEDTVMLSKEIVEKLNDKLFFRFV